MAQAVHELDLIGTGVHVAPALTVVNGLVNGSSGEALADAPGVVWTVAQLAKRVADAVAAVLLIAVLAPLMLVIAIAVKTTSKGPVLFRQTRVGVGGEHFTMWKFRSMSDGVASLIESDADLRREFEANQFKLPAGNSFVTPIGAFLRSSSLDELPQLFQVLTGSMSLVGVRPIEPCEFAQRDEATKTAYTALRPGITGLWQVSGRSATTYEQRCHLDRRYVGEWNLVGDLAILVRTPFAVVRTADTA